MNQEVKNAFEYALLARAAYAKLDTNSNPSSQNSNQLVSDLTNPDKVGGDSNKWPTDLAKYFQSRYEVVASRLGTAGQLSSYQAVLFKDKQSGEYILANRGTQELIPDLFADLLLATTSWNGQLVAMSAFIREIEPLIITSNQVSLASRMG